MTAKIVEVVQTSPGKYAVRLLVPFTLKGKQLTKKDADKRAREVRNDFIKRGIGCVIQYI